MGIKEFNSLFKNLFQTGLKAFPPRRTRRKGVSKAVLCGFSACLPQAGFAALLD